MEDWIGRELRVSYAIPNDDPPGVSRTVSAFLPRAAALGGLGLLAALAACARHTEPASPPPPMSVTPTAAPSPSPLPEPLPEVIASVNGHPIPLRHARIIAEQELKDLAPTPAQRAVTYRRAMEQLIARELLYEEAQARRIKPDEGAIERLRQKVRSEHKDEKAWRDFLAGQGLDPQAFMDELRVRNSVEKMIKQEADRVPAEVPEADARAYYAANPALFESAGRPLPFEDVRDRINFQISTFKRQEALNGLLARLRKAAKIETFI